MHEVVPFPDDVSLEAMAAWMVNPMTALCMLDTVTDEGEKSFIHTAAGSQLGRMITRLTKNTDMNVIHLVRNVSQVASLKQEGAEHVVVTDPKKSSDELVSVLDKVHTRLAFDAIAGDMPPYLVQAMEKSLAKRTSVLGTYGTWVYKKVFLYGALSNQPVVLPFSLGLTYGLNTWVVTPILMQYPERMKKHTQRIVSEIDTTFKTHFSRRIMLDDLLDPQVVHEIASLSTNNKFLVNMHKDD